MNNAMLRRGLVVAVSALTVIAEPGGAAERSLGLHEAIQRAVQRNEQLARDRETVSASEASAGATRGAYDPVFELNGSWARSSQPTNQAFTPATTLPLAYENRAADAGVTLQQLLPMGGTLSLRALGTRQSTNAIYAPFSPAYDTQLGAELRQPLLRDRAIDSARLAMRVADADHQGASAALHRSLIETVAAVERAYWSLVAARLDVGVAEEAVSLAEDQLRETRIRVRSGNAPTTELAQPTSELERRRGELLAASEAASRAGNDLKLNMLSEQDTDLWTDEFVPTDTAFVEAGPIDVAAALDRALKLRPELETVSAVTRRAQAQEAYARDAERPRLDAVVSYDRYGLAGSRNLSSPFGALPASVDGDLGDSFHSLGRGDFDGFRAALVLGLPIGDREARGNAEAAQHTVQAAGAEMARTRNAIRVEVLDAVAALETARQRIQAAQAAREAAEVQFRSEKDRYASGLSTNFLVLTRQNQLSRARLDEIAALTDYRMARTEIGRATGSLPQDRGIQTDH
jgi:HAE1 family hydrophobic/amphiphilic exporter-1